jgi:hypothetical protein
MERLFVRMWVDCGIYVLVLGYGIRVRVVRRLTGLCGFEEQETICL